MKYVDNLFEWALGVYANFCTDSGKVEGGFDPTTGITVVYDLRTGKSAFSKCRKDEKFNKEIGIAVAYTRLKGGEIPKVREKILLKNLNVGDKFNLTVFTDSVYCVIGVNPMRSTETIAVNIKTDRLCRFESYKEVYKIS